MSRRRYAYRQITTVQGIQVCQTKIIQDEQVGFFKFPQEFAPGSVPPAELKIHQELGNPVSFDQEEAALPKALSRNVLPVPHVLAFVYPGGDLGFIKVTGRTVVQLFKLRGTVPEVSHFE